MSLFEASLIPALDADGDTISGAIWTFFASGTNTPITVYADAGLAVPLGSAVVADAAGRFPAIYLGEAQVRAVLRNAAGIIIPNSDIDPVNDGDGANDIAAIKLTGTPGIQSLGLQVPKGVYGSSQNSLSFQTMFSSPSDGPDFDNQRASLLISADTQDDGNSEEQTLCVLTKIGTGFGAAWLPSTVYNVGANVRNNGNVYRCTTSGTSAASGGPAGKTINILDGSVVWKWINDDAINAKVGIYNEVQNLAGGGRGWAQANNFEMEPGYNPDFAVCTEFDLTNNTGIDSQFGQFNRYNLYVFTKGSNRSTASIEVTSTNTTNAAAYWGLHFSGAKLAQNSVIGIDASADNGIGFGVAGGGSVTPSFGDSVIKDGSNALKGLNLLGAYGASAIEIGGTTPAAISLIGTFSSWFIFTPTPFKVYADGAMEAKSLKLDLGSVGDFANDADAAAGGIGLGGIYRNGGALRIRIV